MTAILVATIGTRDLMFQISSGDWFNIGNDRVQNGNIITEQIEVIEDLNPGQKMTFIEIAEYLLLNQNLYLDRLNPVIIGKLLEEKSTEIGELVLIGTDQKDPVPQYIRDKDTINSCKLIKAWVEKKYPKLPTKIVSLGTDGTNPSNFEAMFEWWRKTWRTEIETTDREIWLALKGGVGQASEAGRISGLSLYGDRINFFESHQNDKLNRAGNPSAYTGPFLGTNYLWDRTQQQALGLLDRYDYAGVEELLKPYFHTKKLGAVPKLLQAGIAWNRGEFDSFWRSAKATNVLDNHKQQNQNWWWMAYEQAYLAVIRLKQNNTAEAMLHSFRAVEGGLLEWAKVTFPDDIKDIQNGFPQVLNSILNKHQTLRSVFDKARGNYLHAQWRGSLRREILETVVASARQVSFQYFWSDDCQNKRNELSHRLGGISESEVWSAWGTDIQDRSQWEARILACLNILSGQSFKTLNQASLFARVHDRIRRSIEES
jgi:hypothetical protein